MSPKRVFFVMAGMVVLAMGIAGAGVYFGNNLLQRKSDELMQLKIDSELINEQQRALIQAKKDLAAYAELENIAKSVVPQEKDQARTVREIVKLAEETDISISSITFPTSNLGQAVPRPAPSAEGTSDTPAVVTPPAPTTSQVKPVDGIPGVYQLEIQVQSDTRRPIPYEKLIAFLRRLEQNRRTAQVTNINVTPSTNDRTRVSFSLTVNVYIKP